MKTLHGSMGFNSRRWQHRLAAIPAAFAIIAACERDGEASLRNRYTFNNPAGTATEGAVVQDLVSGSHGTLRVRLTGTPGIDGTFTGTGLQLPGGANATGNAYVDLPNGLISSLHGDATLEAWYTITVVNNTTNWARIWDFGDAQDGSALEITTPGTIWTGGAGDSFFYAPMRDLNTNGQRASIENSNAATQGGVAGTTGGNITTDPNVATAVNQLRHVVVTVVKDADGAGPENGNRMTVYQDGFLSGTVLDGNGGSTFQLENMNDVNNWLGKSNYSGDDQFGGIFHEFRIYDHALSQSQAGINWIVGPDAMESEVLKLEVNPINGQIKIVNTQEVAFPFDYYKISSAMGALSVGGWNSLDDQEGGDPVGTGWDQGASDANELLEFYLGATGDQFDSAGELILGNAFNTSIFGGGNDGDLVFEYGGPNGYLIEGIVDYDSGPICSCGFGDYNLDGSANAADYTVWRNAKAAGTPLPPGTEEFTPGVTDTADYTSWKARYASWFGSGSSVGGAVPEPTTLVSFICGLMIVGLSLGGRRARMAACR